VEEVVAEEHVLAEGHVPAVRLADVPADECPQRRVLVVAGAGQHILQV
jgi:hypothetical protein